MATNSTVIVALALALGTGTAFPRSVAQDSGQVPQQNEAQSVDEASADLLMDALRIRQVLKKTGDPGAERGDRFWRSTSAFADAVKAAPNADHVALLPLLKSLNASASEAALQSSTPDWEAIDSIQQSLDEQVSLLTAPGAFPGSKHRVKVEVRAIRSGQPVNGLYVWIDLACCVRSASSAMALPNVTSPARGEVIPGTYVVRLRQGETTLTSRRILIDGTAASSQVDMVLE